MRGVACVARVLLAIVLLLPGTAFAQTGNINGVVRDPQGGAMPGVTVEVTSPALIEKVRSTVTDSNGRYQIVALPVGTYQVSFTLSGFATFVQRGVGLSNEYTATINADMKPGDLKEVINVQARTTDVDVINARQRQVFTGDEIKELPTSRNLSDLINLVPGIATDAGASGTGVPMICSGGVADASGGIESTSGPRSGCGPLIQNFNSHSSINDPYSLNQGRVQLDGMGIQSFAGGGRSSYVADISSAQEISFTLSGGLGESETGGATINIVPRTGGNRYSGSYFTSYGDSKFFDRNDGTRPSTFNNRLDHQYDVNGSYGGPVLRDRLWFQFSARRQERRSILTSSFRNLNVGILGANYVGDNDSPLDQGDLYQNGSLRLTVQATQKNKFNVFWDEQYTCENPCRGVVDGFTSIEASPSILTRPLHVAQLSWTNPFTNKILFDAGASHYGSHRAETRNLFEPDYSHLPQIQENGTTIATPSRATTQVTNIVSGSINNETNWNIDNVQTRASASYVTGSHNAKFGYQGGYLSRVSTPHFNQDRLQYQYDSPAGNCSAVAPALGAVTGAPPAAGQPPNGSNWCGLFPDGRRVFDGRLPSDPLMTEDELVANGFVTRTVSSTGTTTLTSTKQRPPVPRLVRQYIPYPTDEKVWFAAFYLQDQWTLNRMTLSGALRYDLSRSNFGKTCVGPDRWMSEELQYCVNDGGVTGNGKGVDFQDITPRIGVAYDVFGTGKTSLKLNVGKYIGGAQVGGIYTATNPAQAGRATNSYGRTWRDLDGDRIVDCDLMVPLTAPTGTASFPTNGECGGEEAGATANARRFGRDPYTFNQADVLGLQSTTVGAASAYCGQQQSTTRADGTVILLQNQKVINYCNNYMAQGGKSLTSGWNKRSYEWQLGFGIQHELLPRLSMDITYNRRWSGNRVITDVVNVTDPTGTQVYVPNGCDLYSTVAGGTVNADECMNHLLHYNSDFYDFYGIQAPLDPRLPNGGGYVVSGIPVAQLTQMNTSSVTVNTIDFTNRVKDVWDGIDTSFTLRARGGLRLSGGTSTGRRVRDACKALVDNPPQVTLREGRELACDAIRPYQTNVRGTASYTIPWADVLLSTTFSYRPGAQINANYTVNPSEVIWAPGSQVLNGGSSPITGSTVSTNLLANDTFGEGIRLFDIRLAKNVRFAGKRVNIGADLFNAFNSDAAVAYCSTYPQCSATQTWRTVSNITTPRYARFQISFDF